jgi:SAM-dependent methyltransferase
MKRPWMITSISILRKIKKLIISGYRKLFGRQPVKDTFMQTRGQSAIETADFKQSIENYLEGRNPSKGPLNTINRLLPNGGNILDYSSMDFFHDAIEKLLRNITHRSVIGVNYELDEYARQYGLAKYDLCINAEVLEHLLFDPSHMVFSINQMLKPGGYVIVSTPNATSLANCIKIMNGQAPTLWNQLNATSKLYYERHNRDWTPLEVSRILEEHGFETLDIYTRDYYESTKQILADNGEKCAYVLKNGTHNFWGDTLFVTARKQRDVDAPVHNSWLYVLPGQF